MKLKERVRVQFEKAGWIKGRDVIKKYDNNFIKKAPIFLIDFLKEFGDLEVEDSKLYESQVISKLKLSINDPLIISEDKEELDYLFPLIGFDIYIFGFLDPDIYQIGCDKQGNIYMIGDAVYHIAKTLERGIEILITDDWENGYLELNEETGEWFTSEKYNGWND